jgi:hypothetical protein
MMEAARSSETSTSILHGAVSQKAVISRYTMFGEKCIWNKQGDDQRISLGDGVGTGLNWLVIRSAVISLQIKKDTSRISNQLFNKEPAR